MTTPRARGSGSGTCQPLVGTSTLLHRAGGGWWGAEQGGGGSFEGRGTNPCLGRRSSLGGLTCGPEA